MYKVLADTAKCRQIFNFLKRANVDICLLQETHSCEKKNNVWCAEWGGKIVFSNGGTSSRVL